MSEGPQRQQGSGVYPSSGVSHDAGPTADPFGPDTAEDVFADPFSQSTTVRPAPQAEPATSSAASAAPAASSGTGYIADPEESDAFGTSARLRTHQPETHISGIPAVRRSQIDDEQLADILSPNVTGRDGERSGRAHPRSRSERTGSTAYTGTNPQPQPDHDSLSAATQSPAIHESESGGTDRIGATRTAPQDIYRNTQDLSPGPADAGPASESGPVRAAEPAITHGSYPSAEAPTAKPSPARRSFGLRRMMRSDDLPTAPMRVVDRLVNSPFANPRRRKEHTEARRTLNFSLRLAETMFHFGADSRDVETAIVATCATYGVEDVDVDITNQSVIINYVSDPELDPYSTHAGAAVGPGGGEAFSHTVVRVVRSWSDNYAGLTETHRLVKTITDGDLSRDDAEKRLNRILSKPKPFPRWLVRLSNAAAAAALTLGIGGTWQGSVASFLTFLLVQVMAGRLAAWRIPSFFTMAACSALVTLIAMVLWTLGVPISPPHMVGSGLIMLLPTLTLVSTIQDAIHGFPVTSAGRLISTGLSFMGLIVGIAIAISITSYMGFEKIKVDSVVFGGAHPLVNFVFMIIATAFIAVTVQVKPEHILPGVVSAVVGLLVYHLFGWLGGGTRMVSMLGAIGVGCASALIAQRRVIPQVVLAVPGMTFLLPGLSIFRGMYILTVNIDPVTGIIPMLNAGAIIMSMAAAVVLGNYLMRPFMSKDPKIKAPSSEPREQRLDPLAG